LKVLRKKFPEKVKFITVPRNVEKRAESTMTSTHTTTNSQRGRGARIQRGGRGQSRGQGSRGISRAQKTSIQKEQFDDDEDV